MRAAGKSDRIGAVCAVVGSLLLITATYTHPLPPHPNDAVAAFTEYATDRPWVAIHLAQLAGFILIIAALLILAGQLGRGIGGAWSRLAEGGAIASLAVATVLQAVDGIALKSTVDAWANAAVSEKQVAFHAAFAVRQVELGLDSTLSILFGATVTAFGIALLDGRMYPRWLGGLAIVGAPLMAVAGVAMAYTGYSSLGMGISMIASYLLLLWMLLLGVLMWRRGRMLSEERAI